MATAEEYAEFLGNRFDEFEKIADSGYGLYWFPQCFYLYWQAINKVDNLELYGNMGPHYESNRVFQFSEVLVDKINNDEYRAEYQSDIFLFSLFGLERRIKKQLLEVKNHICKKKSILPFKIFLIRFNNLVEEKDANIADPDILFTDIIWHHSFKSKFWERMHSASIGVLEGSFQSYINKLNF